MLLLCLLVCWSPDLRAEFYKYVDEEGNIFYVDDLSRVPEKYRNRVNVYREKYDNLSVKEKVFKTVDKLLAKKQR